MRRRLVLVAVLAGLAGAPAPGQAAPRTLDVGAARLTPCSALPAAFGCGTLHRPLDPARPDGRRIPIAFAWRPASRPGRRTGPPIVAVEGGPGYPSTGSFAEFTATFGPLLRHRDLLLVDNRGTGASSLIDCPRLQRWTGRTDGEAYARRAAACARTTDERLGAGAHDRFGTADAVDDLAAVLRHLRLPRVALYGDSYGSWFAQAFAARHPGRLSSVTLDSTYPVVGLDPFYVSSMATARDALNAVCRRDPGCRAATAGTGTTATDRLGRLLAAVRARPIVGTARDVDGSVGRARVTARTLVDLVQWAGSDPVVDRELDAAVRAALAADPAPLLRLAVQASTWNAGTTPAAYYSDGAYATVSCTDYPQLFDRRAAPAQRRAQLAEAVAGVAGSPVFAPFTLPEWLSMDAGSEPFRACLDWPAPGRVRPPVPAGAAPLPARVPLLVVGGDLDSLTPLRDARAFAPRIAIRSRVVEVRNTTHVTSQGFTTLLLGASCARRVIRGFLRRPAALARLDARCGPRVPHVHTAGAYPRRLVDAALATVRAGADPGPAVRRMATVAAGALADATIRRSYRGDNGTVPGLRGGRVVVRGERVLRLRLRGVRFTTDTRVTGTGRWRPRDGRVTGRLRVRERRGRTVVVRLRWTQRSRLATARVGGARLALPAP